MMRKLIGKVTLPRRVFRNLDILPWATEVNTALQQIRDRLTPSSFGGGKGFGKRLPFEVVLINTGTAEAPDWKVRVYPGYVNERLPGSGDDQTLTHEPGNLYEETPEPPPDPPVAPKLSEFSVSEGDGVYVSVSVNEDGTVAAGTGEDYPVSIEIAPFDPGPDSNHYQPKVDNETSDGSAGTYKYKLAEVIAADSGGLKLKKYLSGSHISHFQELPAIKATIAAAEGIGVIPKKWDNDAKCYKLRSLTKGLGQLNITTNSDEVEVRGNKKSLDVIVLTGDTEETAPLMQFVDGLNDTGNVIVGDETPLPDADRATIRIPTVQNRPASPQINVSDVGAVGTVYQVEGNGVDAYLEITVNGDPGLTLNTVDGLVTEIVGSPLNIETTTLPDGAQGDMLYWNVVAGIGSWTLLANPGAPTSPNRTFLTHDGTVPAWVEMEAKEISICEGGTPVTKTIYVDI